MILNEAKKQHQIEIDVGSEFQEYWASIIAIVAAEVEWRETKEKDVCYLRKPYNMIAEQ